MFAVDMTPVQSAKRISHAIPPAKGAPILAARRRVQDAGQWAPWQTVGRRFAIGCVALEITQRCNLDCTFCYLSESSEALHDIPLQEVFRRIDMIRLHYGVGTDVQVTGGEPTLRKRDELLAIVNYIKARDMNATLMTNGIKASRDLLAALAAGGLTDVAFHVDMTQLRRGYDSEEALNALRSEYIERARGLDLSVFFNTTICGDNQHEMPSLVQFFIRNCDVVRLCSFQIGAATGRGIGRVTPGLTIGRVQATIAMATSANLRFDVVGSGHSGCNRYAYALIINGRVYDLFADAPFVQRVLAATAHLGFDRRSPRRAIATLTKFVLSHPALLWAVVRRAGAFAWRARWDLLAARGRIRKLSFFIHNFMGAHELDPERIAACSFMAMTPTGPLSMCQHNARRDEHLLVPAIVKREHKLLFWEPVNGRLSDHMPDQLEVTLTRKNARGRALAAVREQLAAP